MSVCVCLYLELLSREVVPQPQAHGGSGDNILREQNRQSVFVCYAKLTNARVFK